MVLLIIIPMKNGYFIGNIPNIFRQTHMLNCFLASTYLHEELTSGKVQTQGSVDFRYGQTMSNVGFAAKMFSPTPKEFEGEHNCQPDK